MKKLALAIGFAAYIIFGASSGSLAAYRVDNAAGVAGRIWSDTATNARLLFVNQAFYPETTVTFGAGSPAAHGTQERADMAQRSTTPSTDTERLYCNGDICLTP